MQTTVGTSVLQLTDMTHFPKSSFKLTYDVDLDIFSFVAWSLELKCGQFSCIEVTHGFAFEFAFFSSSPKN